MGNIINPILEWFVQVIGFVLVGIFDMFKDLLIYCFEQIGTLIVAIMGTIPAIPGADLLQEYWMLIPVEARDLALRAGLGEASTIIITAIGIRLLLQLIPFVRLGS